MKETLGGPRDLLPRVEDLRRPDLVLEAGLRANNWAF